MIPFPTRCQRRGPGATLAEGMVVAAPDGPASDVAHLLAAELGAGTGWDVPVAGAGATSPQGTIRLSGPGDEPGPAFPRAEAYTLRVHEGGADIEAPSAAGLFYGTRTLLQLLPPALLRRAPVATVGTVAIEGWDIEDSPRFGWRGAHLDVARHFQPKRFLLELVDLLSLHKFNVLHLHLTDDQGWRVQIDKFPRLTEVGAWRRESPAGHHREGRFDGTPHGGFYSKEDLAEVVAYAARRFITVVPEIDMPGHMQAAIASYPDLGNTGQKLEVSTQWGISEHVLNLEEATVALCAAVLEEVMDIFPSPYVHIGGDECPSAEWEASPRAHQRAQELGLDGVGRLQAWFTARMAEVTAARGRSLVAWDEVLEAGAPPGCVLAVWRGDHALSAPQRAAAEGHDVIMCPEPWTYFDWSYADDPREPVAIRPAISVEKAYQFEPVAEGMDESSAAHIIGGQCQLWTEYVPTPERAEYMYFPRACATAESLWSRQPKDWAGFSHRLAEHTARLDALGVNYRPLNGPTPGQARTWP